MSGIEGNHRQGLEKFSDDKAFQDPVVRCYHCNDIQRLPDIKERGCCGSCGMRRIAKLRTFNDDEHKQMLAWEVDPDFIALFRVAGETPHE